MQITPFINALEFAMEGNQSWFEGPLPDFATEFSWEVWEEVKGLGRHLVISIKKHINCC